MSIINEDPIDEGLLMADNIKYLDEAPKEPRGTFVLLMSYVG